MIKAMKYNILFFAVAVMTLFCGCTDAEDAAAIAEGTVFCPELRVNSMDMTLCPVSRASAPMSPDVEKYIKTIAAFEFDNEGLHENRATTYHFIDFVAGTVDGVSGVGNIKPAKFGIVETSLDEIEFEARSNGIICLVANVTQEQVDVLYDQYREPGETYGCINFEQFKKWQIPFDYYDKPNGQSYDESVSGHIKNMYMFGYYKGRITPAEVGSIIIDMGRMASRIDITVVNETGRTIDKRFGYHFDNAVRYSYFFPMSEQVPEEKGAGDTRTIICTGVGDRIDDAPYLNETFPAGSSHSAYFYVGAHSASSEADATKLHLFYNSRIIEDETVQTGGRDYQVPLCSVPPSHAGGVDLGYSLSRNTRYQFTIRLRSSAEAPVSRGAVAGDEPGEFIVYLPV